MSTQIQKINARRMKGQTALKRKVYLRITGIYVSSERRYLQQMHYLYHKHATNSRPM